MYGTVNYQARTGSGVIGDNPVNGMLQLAQRLAAMRGAGSADAGGTAQVDPMDNPAMARSFAQLFDMPGSEAAVVPPMHPRGMGMPHPMAAAAYQPAPNPQRLPYPVSRPAYAAPQGIGIGYGRGAGY